MKVPTRAGNADPKPTAAAPPEEESASCWRWLLVILAMPVLVILSVVGIVVWLVLLPVKIICCPIGERHSSGFLAYLTSIVCCCLVDDCDVAIHVDCETWMCNCPFALQVAWCNSWQM